MNAAASLGAPRAAGPGLVNAPTTRPRGLAPEIVLSNLDAAVKERAKKVGAFLLDQAARRISGLRCAVSFSARAHCVSTKGSRPDQAWMVTLTYAGDNSSWRPDHLTTAVNTMRKWCKRQGFPARYVWVAELQKRGVIHYHLVFWLPQGVRCPKWDKRGWWPYGMTQSVPAKNAVGYLMSYLKKDQLAERGRLPKGARNYGVGGLDHSMRRARRWLRLPAFVQGNSSIYDNWRQEIGGGWRAPDGTHFPSEFMPTMVGGQRALFRVARYPKAIDAAGPFSWITDRAVALQLQG